jgi:hypothetical protein
MSRSDLAYVVSRALAIWVFLVGANALVLAISNLADKGRYGWQGSGWLYVGLALFHVGVAIMLWSGALGLAGLSKDDTRDPTKIEHLSTAIFPAVGLYYLIAGVSNLGDAIPLFGSSLAYFRPTLLKSSLQIGLGLATMLWSMPKLRALIGSPFRIDAVEHEQSIRRNQKRLKISIRLTLHKGVPGGGSMQISISDFPSISRRSIPKSETAHRWIRSCSGSYQ